MKIAIIGALSNVGREVLSFFEEDNFAATKIYAVENKTPMGTQVSYGDDKNLDVHNLDDFDFEKTDISIFICNPELAVKYIPRALRNNNKIIDGSGQYLAESFVPLIIGGVNDEDIKKAGKNIVAIPSSATTQMLLALKGIHDKYKIKRIVTTNYASTSVYGTEAMDELFSQTRKIFTNDSLTDDKKIFNKQIAFNVIPQVGDFIGDETSAEWTINVETKKILGPDVRVHANCAIVPAFIGVAQYINVETEEDVDVDEARVLIEDTEGVIVFDKNVDGGYFCMTDVQGENAVYVSRLRQDISVANGISMWVAADNLRVGIAKNAFQVTKLLLD